MSDRASAAQALARRPFVAGVIQLWPNSKSEYTDKPGHAGKKCYRPKLTRTHATKDEAQIAQWWADNPQGNIGYLVSAGFVIAESDPRNGGTLEPDALAYCEHTASGQDSLHIAYRLPDELKDFAGVVTVRPGVEIHGHGQRITGAGSTIQGKPYSVVHDVDDVPLAPAWVIDAINEREAKQAAKLAALMLSTAKIAPTQTDSQRGRRWAEAGLLALAAELHDAKPGTRNASIGRIAFKAGQLTSYLQAAMIESHLLAACAHFDQPLKVAATVRRQVAAGALEPRHPMDKTQHSDTRHALAEMVRLVDRAQWAGKMPFKTAKGEGNVRATTARAALAGIVQQATKANTFDVRLSQRHTAELMHGSKRTAWHVLHALQNADVLQLIEHAGKEIDDPKDAGKTIITSHLYRLTASGFLALQRAEFDAQACCVSKSSVASMKGSDIIPVTASSSCWPSVDLLTQQAEIDEGRQMGIFGHFQLGRASYVLARLLAHAPMTFGQLVKASGFCGSTVSRALTKLAGAGMVERGQRGKASSLSSSLLSAVAQTAAEMNTPERMATRAKQHEEERDDWKKKRNAQRDDGLNVTMNPPATQLTQNERPVEALPIEPVAPTAAKRVTARYAPALDALREVRHDKGWLAALVAGGDVPNTRITFDVPDEAERERMKLARAAYAARCKDLAGQVEIDRVARLASVMQMQ